MLGNLFTLIKKMAIACMYGVHDCKTRELCNERKSDERHQDDVSFSLAMARRVVTQAQGDWPSASRYDNRKYSASSTSPRPLSARLPSPRPLLNASPIGPAGDLAKGAKQDPLQPLQFRPVASPRESRFRVPTHRSQLMSTPQHRPSHLEYELAREHEWYAGETRTQPLWTVTGAVDQRTSSAAVRASSRRSTKEDMLSPSAATHGAQHSGSSAEVLASLLGAAEGTSAKLASIRHALELVFNESLHSRQDCDLILAAMSVWEALTRMHPLSACSHCMAYL